jgi:hypothetical protein
MSKRPYIGKSDAQSNAEALAARGLPYTAASQVSFRLKWDWHRREPRDLREAVRMARQAYQEEVPVKLHDTDIGPDGTPRMSARAEGYIFGSPTASDAPRDEPALVSYYLAPFRATLSGMERGDEATRKRAAVVSHITIGSQGPQEAAISEGVPAWCAKLVAYDALSAFLRRLTDVKLDLRREESVA